MNNDYYITNLYGIDYNFEMDNKDINYCIIKAYKKNYGTIIVKKCLNGYKEIVTGKKFSELKIIHKYVNHYYLLNNSIMVPNKPFFVIVECHVKYDINNSKTIRIATKEEIDNYLIKYNNRKFELLDYYNKIDNLTMYYLNNAKENYYNNSKKVLKK